MEPTRKHRTLDGLLIDRGLQLRFAAVIAGSGLGVSLIFTAVTRTLLLDKYSMLIQLSAMSESAKELMDSEISGLWSYMVVTSVAFAILCFGWGIYYSHRLAGPIFRIRKVINEYHNGNPNLRIQLRPKDDFHELAKDVNELLDLAEKQKK